jgi:hypothetical protein
MRIFLRLLDNPRTQNQFLSILVRSLKVFIRSSLRQVELKTIGSMISMLSNLKKEKKFQLRPFKWKPKLKAG